MSKHGMVVFAKDVKALAKFYEDALAASVSESAASHIVLQTADIELVIHNIPKSVAKNIVIEDPPVQRATVAIKPALVVDSLQRVRTACEQHGGWLKPQAKAWKIRGLIVLDGCDPEGNVLQFKQEEQ